jgi:hypothetical protein
MPSEIMEVIFPISVPALEMRVAREKGCRSQEGCRARSHLAE